MIRRVLLAAALTVATFLLVPGSPAQARACALGSRCTLDSYADNTYTTLVGSIFTDCDGSGSSWGRRTAYQDFTETPC